MNFQDASHISGQGHSHRVPALISETCSFVGPCYILWWRWAGYMPVSKELKSG